MTDMTMDKMTTASPAAAGASEGAAGGGVWTQVQGKRRTQQRVPSRALAHDRQSGSRRASSPARSDTSSRTSYSTAASTAASVRSNRSRASRASSSVVSTATAASRASTARHGSKRRAERPPPISTLGVGASVTGVVTGVQSWGAFVSCGVSKDGLLHAREADADGRYVSDVTSLLKPGDELTLRVLSVDSEAGRFTLTRRAQHDARHSPKADSFRLSRRTEHAERPAQQALRTPTTAPATAPTATSRAELLAAMLDRMRDRDGACAFARECLEAARREVEPAHVRVCEAFLARSEGARHGALVPLTKQDEGGDQGAQAERGEGGERGGSTASEEQEEHEEKVCPSAAAVLRGDACAPVLATLPPSPEVVATTTVRGKVLKLYKLPWATWTQSNEVEVAA